MGDENRIAEQVKNGKPAVEESQIAAGTQRLLRLEQAQEQEERNLRISRQNVRTLKRSIAVRAGRIAELRLALGAKE